MFFLAATNQSISLKSRDKRLKLSVKQSNLSPKQRTVGVVDVSIYPTLPQVRYK